MASITIRALPANTLRALESRAAKAGRSTEAEICDILARAVRSPVGLGSALASIGERIAGVEPVVTRHDAIKPADFE